MYVQLCSEFQTPEYQKHLITRKIDFRSLEGLAIQKPDKIVQISDFTYPIPFTLECVECKSCQSEAINHEQLLLLCLTSCCEGNETVKMMSLIMNTCTFFC
jgi:hypothetical protein